MTKIYSVDDCNQAMEESIPFEMEMEGSYTKAYRIRYANAYMKLMLGYMKDRAMQDDEEAVRLLKLMETDPDGAVHEVYDAE